MWRVWRVLMNLSDLGFRVVVCGGRRGKATERACGARIFEKSSGICLKINDLEDKITETSNPSYSSRGKNPPHVCLFPYSHFPYSQLPAAENGNRFPALRKTYFIELLTSVFSPLRERRRLFCSKCPGRTLPHFTFQNHRGACTWCIDSWQWHLHLCVICLSSAKPFLVNTESICSGSLIECLPQTNGSPGKGENLDMQIWIEAPEKAVLKIYIFPVRSSLCNENEP